LFIGGRVCYQNHLLRSRKFIIELYLLPITLVSLVLLVNVTHVQNLSVLIQLLNLLTVPSLVENQLELKSFKGIVWSQVLLRVGVVCRWREKHIESQSEGLLEHSRDHSFQQLARQLKTRVCIDLNHPHLVVAVDHKVEPKDLKIMLSVVWVHFQVGCLDGIKCNSPHFGVDHFTETKLTLTHC
jgi:hypothetical protein